ncbi:unnamed protein product [Mytilus coruscus]|uniref:C-type lectin domain-containing protein n=1 Tax=Mytilus coruscus TaxID=42192 RepID=A0A6J8DBU6_MYTCO|nr:unnamed protein product [Mytilus coruscus]
MMTPASGSVSGGVKNKLQHLSLVIRITSTNELFWPGRGGCSVDFYYCRELDICYQFGPTIQATEIRNASVCPGNDLLRIDSKEKKYYIKLVTADIGLVYHAGICIQGKNTGAGWMYNDGSSMEYFDWMRSEPSGLSNVIMVHRYANYQWAVPSHDSPSMIKMYLPFCILYIQTAFIPAIGESMIRLISADYMPEHDNNFEEMNSVGIYNESSFFECTIKCSLDERCLSFFHNNLTGLCVLHQDPFTYTVMSLRANGWKFYLTRERCGRCLVDFVYYRELDLCYQFGPLVQPDAAMCLTSNLIRIDSRERHQYIRLVTAHIGLVYDAGICIQGKNTGAGWMYNDGSRIKFNRWIQDEPNGLSNVIIMYRFAHNGWTVPKNDNVCSYICEY